MNHIDGTTNKQIDEINSKANKLKKETTTCEIVNLKKTIEDQKSKLAALDNEQDLMRKTGQEKADKLLQLNILLQKTNIELKSEFDVILSKQKTERLALPECTIQTEMLIQPKQLAKQ